VCISQAVRSLIAAFFGIYRDGTVSVLSLGAMCVDGWKPGSIYNPANISVITHEIKHEPQAFDPRGGEFVWDTVSSFGWRAQRAEGLFLTLCAGPSTQNSHLL
jgi:hypothetical protein